MSETYMIIVSCVTVIIQLLLCLLCRKVWVRLLPLAMIQTAMSAFFVIYLCSKNWAYLILILFAFQMLCLAAAAWALYGLYRLVKILIKMRRCKEKILDNRESV